MATTSIDDEQAESSPDIDIVEQLNHEVKRQARELAILIGRLEFERSENLKKVEALKLSLTLISSNSAANRDDETMLSVERSKMVILFRDIILAIRANFESKDISSDKKSFIYHLVRSAKIVDEHWYLEKNTDVAEAKMDPVEHYVEFGINEGRSPRPLFER